MSDHRPLTTDHSAYPCFCLCFTFVQMTRTTPLRRTILQFSQILRTLARTFILTPVDFVESAILSVLRLRLNSAALQAPGRPAIGQDIGAVLGDGYRVLKVRCRQSVLGYDGPVIRQQIHIASAHHDHGLDS